MAKSPIPKSQTQARENPIDKICEHIDKAEEFAAFGDLEEVERTCAILSAYAGKQISERHSPAIIASLRDFQRYYSQTGQEYKDLVQRAKLSPAYQSRTASFLRAYSDLDALINLAQAGKETTGHRPVMYAQNIMPYAPESHKDTLERIIRAEKVNSAHIPALAELKAFLKLRVSSQK